MTSLAEWILQSERPVRMQSKQRQSQLPEDQIFGTETFVNGDRVKITVEIVEQAKS